MKWFKIVGILVPAYLLLTTILVNFDKDIRLLCEEFISEVLSVDFHEVSTRVTDKDIYNAINRAYGGRLDRVIAKRDVLLKEKGIWMLGGWYASVNTGEFQPKTFAFYLTVTPWRLNLRD